MTRKENCRLDEQRTEKEMGASSPDYDQDSPGTGESRGRVGGRDEP